MADFKEILKYSSSWKSPVIVAMGTITFSIATIISRITAIINAFCPVK